MENLQKNLQKKRQKMIKANPNKYNKYNNLV